METFAEVEWRPGKVFPRVAFIVTNPPMEPVMDGALLQWMRNRRAGECPIFCV